MDSRYINIKGQKCRLIKCGIAVVGSGAAALNAALEVKSNSRYTQDVLLVTEGLKMGTSRNTGSDKQTYYKLSTCIEASDSAREMAEDYFACGSMHGDLALVEAAGSAKGFYKLVSLGVPFPSDMYGEYTGYRTDHDERKRATSCGPLTSKYMYEALLEACRQKSVPMIDGYRAVEVLKKDGRAVGIVCLSDREVSEENPAGLAVIICGSLIWGTGGPSAVYYKSVYPESQNCSLGAPLAAGATAANLTESQYGIASVKFRWNLSGSYQQVIPKYYSTDENGEEHEFLKNYFGDNEPFAVFRKGYEWPFDPDKLTSGSHSSIVDMAVFREISLGRRVFMDFRRESDLIIKKGFSRETIGNEAYDYLEGCGAVADSPIKRLRIMNDRAYNLYLDHGIDLEKEPLEIGVCAQHMNGGLECDIWYENPGLSEFYPVGECAGVFGIKRPGGSALNSTQVSSARAARKACADNVEPGDFSDSEIENLISFSSGLASLIKSDGDDAAAIIEKRIEDEKLHDECAAFIRNPEKIRALMNRTKKEIDEFFDCSSASDQRALTELAINYDILVTRLAILASIIAYVDDGGLSRGSYLIGSDKIPETVITDKEHRDKVLIARVDVSSAPSTMCYMQKVRPIPHVDNQFENVYNSCKI